MESDGRKHPVHALVHERHNTPVIVFLTVCTKNRKAILANDSAHQLLRAAWQTQPSWLVGRYVILPDHLHLFCAPAELIWKTQRSSLQFNSIEECFDEQAFLGEELFGFNLGDFSFGILRMCSAS